MSNENHNNLQPWKSKLEELNALPDQQLDKGAAWDILYLRLNQKQPAGKTPWYWVAAACLLLAVIFSVFFINNSSHKITASVTRTTSATTENAVTKTTMENDEVKKARDFVLPENEIPVVKKTYNKAIKPVALKRILKIRLSDSVSEQSLALSPVADSIDPVTASPGLAIARQPVKKKLRVVHANELGEPLEEMTGIEHNVSTHYFQIRFANQEVYTSPPVSKEKAITFLKINTPVN